MILSGFDVRVFHTFHHLMSSVKVHSQFFIESSKTYTNSKYRTKHKVLALNDKLRRTNCNILIFF